MFTPSPYNLTLSLPFFTLHYTLSLPHNIPQPSLHLPSPSPSLPNTDLNIPFSRKCHTPYRNSRTYTTNCNITLRPKELTMLYRTCAQEHITPDTCWLNPSHLRASHTCTSSFCPPLTFPSKPSFKPVYSYPPNLPFLHLPLHT